MFQEPSLFLSPPDAESDQGGKIIYHLKKEKKFTVFFAESITDELTGLNSLKWKNCKKNYHVFYLILVQNEL